MRTLTGLSGRFACVVLVASCQGFATRGDAGDWPQILGPHRNGQADGESLQPWTESGLRRYGPAHWGKVMPGRPVADGRVLIFHRVGDAEQLDALEARTGRSLWRVAFPASYRGGIDPDTGPRCVPVVHAGGDVRVRRGGGPALRLSWASGRRRWTRETYREYRGSEGYFGAGSSPLVVGRQIAGQRRWLTRQCIVAFSLAGRQDPLDRDGGKGQLFLARAGDGGRATARHFRHAIDRRVHLNPRGRGCPLQLSLRSARSHGQCRHSAGFGRQLFLTANYGVGAKAVRLGAKEATPLWANDESLSSQYASPIYADGYLFGIHGREDVGGTGPALRRGADGDVQWSERGFGTAHLILVRDQLLVFAVDGRLVLAKASPRGLSSPGDRQDFGGRHAGLACPGGRLPVFSRECRRRGHLAMPAVGENGERGAPGRSSRMTLHSLTAT